MHRAVAPIIATLLMVAIAVVGGILIFVFAQGFFTDTQIGAPTIELLEIYGYDARDQALLKLHSNDELTLSAAADSILDDDDGIVIYFRNRGSSTVLIERVKIYGEQYELATAATCSATLPAKEFFVMVVGDEAPNTATQCSNVAVVQSGEDASIILRYDETTNGEIKIGRPIPIQLITANGGTFSKQLQNGVRL